jgi:hypothetical protein
VFRTWFSFIPVNAYTAPLLAFAIASGFTIVTHPPRGHEAILIAVAATGGVGLLNKITDVSAPEAHTVRHRSRRTRSSPSPARDRIPSL